METENKQKYLDNNGLAYALRKINARKADLNNPTFTGTPMAPTPLNAVATDQIATTKYVSNLMAPFEGRLERFDETIEAIRGRSVLGINTVPYSNTEMTPDGKVHAMRASMKLIKQEADINEVFLGDTILFNGYIYQIAYIDHALDEATTSRDGGVYLNVLGNIIGPTGPQGIQGIQGPQGPKGEAGEGFFIVTEEDFTRIVNAIEQRYYLVHERSDSSEAIAPNTFYDFGPQYRLEITFAEPTNTMISNEYMFQFFSPADRPTTLIMPEDVKWCYEPVIEAGKTYQISVLNNLAVICGA